LTTGHVALNIAFKVTIKLNTTLGMKNFERGKGHINGDIVIMKRNIKCGRWARKRIVSICCTVGPVHHGGTFSEPSAHDVMMVKKLSDFRILDKEYQTSIQNFH
jgi:hypothetical protein